MDTGGDYSKIYYYYLNDCTVVFWECNNDGNDNMKDLDNVVANAEFDLDYYYREDEELSSTVESTRGTSTSDTSSNGFGIEVTDSKKKTNIWICAQDVVNQDLKSPSTAKFCAIQEATVYHQTGKQYFVMGYVDSENGFGAMMRTNFAVWLTMTKHGYKDAHAEYDEQ